MEDGVIAFMRCHNMINGSKLLIFSDYLFCFDFVMTVVTRLVGLLKNEKKKIKKKKFKFFFEII